MAINFSGTSERITFASDNIDGTAQLSFSLWFNHDSTSAVGRMFMLNEIGISGFQVAANFITSQVNIGSSNNTTFWGIDTSSRLRGSVTVGTWHHVCGTVSVNDGGGDNPLSRYGCRSSDSAASVSCGAAKQSMQTTRVAVRQAID